MSQTMAYDRNDDGTLDVKLLEVVDGEKTELEKVTFDTQAFDEAIQLKLQAYGFSKIAAERTSDVSPGTEKLEDIQVVYDALLEGNWERERKKGGGPTVSIEVEALAALRNASVKATQTALRKYSKEEQKAILANEAVQNKVKELQAAQEEAEELDFGDLAGATE